MAYFSGFAAHRGLKNGETPSEVAHSINEGLGDGFEVGAPGAIMALMIMGWTG